MDSFQGSSPRKFISFCLENPREETQSTPNPTLVQVPTEIGSVCLEPENQLDQQTSSKEDGSDEDVNAYAANIVRLKEKSSIPGTEQVENTEDQTQQIPEPTTAGLDNTNQVRTSTTVPISPGEAHSSSLTSLISALRITTTAECSLPELVPVTASLIREHSGTHLSASEDTASSVYEVPALPGL